MEDKTGTFQLLCCSPSYFTLQEVSGTKHSVKNYYKVSAYTSKPPHHVQRGFIRLRFRKGANKHVEMTAFDYFGYTLLLVLR